MLIIGAGMAGLLAAGMIRDKKARIIEAQPTLPNNHSAVLRFRSSVVGDTLGIEFKEVTMMKCYEPYSNPVADNLSYSLKCTGVATLRSIITADASIQKRFVAPDNLIQQMADRVEGQIEFNSFFDPSIHSTGEPIISTIPMPVLMGILNYPKANFQYCAAYNLTATIPNCDAYVSVYVPSPESGFSRISLTGNKLIAEIPEKGGKSPEEEADLNLILKIALDYLGIPSLEEDAKDLDLTKQKYAKILPIDEAERKKFLVWATDNHNIYSLGRYATWRPGLLLDDVVNDVRVIRKMIKNGSYDQRKK